MGFDHATRLGPECACRPQRRLRWSWSRPQSAFISVAHRKIIDRAWCREKENEKRFKGSCFSLRGAYGETAKLYESVGSIYMAKAYWQKVEEADPGNSEAETRLLAIEVAQLKADAHELDVRARTTFSVIGIETARPLYIQAIQKYELLLSKSPDDEASRTAMNDLRRLF